MPAMRFVTAALIAILVSAPVLGDGFAFFDHNARATGMAGAYVASAFDPSAVFYNPGGLALMKKKKGATVGVSTAQIQPSFQYQGTGPGIGAGTVGQREFSLDAVPHAFMALPLGKSAVSGTGIYSPFRMKSEWSNPAAFAGRFLATSSEIQSWDITQVVALPLGKNAGIGVGGIYRLTTLKSSRRISTIAGGQTFDVADVTMETDSTASYGWTAGFLWRPSARFAIGASHRSGMDVEFEGAGSLTQIPTGNTQLDALIASSFPFGQDLALASQLSLPAQTNFGIAFGLTKSTLIEIDVNQTQWKELAAVPFVFPNNPTLTTSQRLDFEDTLSYRAGFRYTLATGPQIRLGYALEKSPQPDETVGPFFAELDRNVVTAGIGLDWLDVAVAYSTGSDRAVTTSVDAINGNYRGESWLVALTVTK
jgi:long-chain fatty acid transport protein